MHLSYLMCLSLVVRNGIGCPKLSCDFHAQGNGSGPCWFSMAKHLSEHPEEVGMGQGSDDRSSYTPCAPLGAAYGFSSNPGHTLW